MHHFSLLILFVVSTAILLQPPVSAHKNPSGIYPHVNMPRCFQNPSHQLSQSVIEKLRDLNDVINRNNVTYDTAKLAVLSARNLVKNRALFFSMALQFLNKTDTQFELQPGFLYYYVSDVSALSGGHPALYGSGVFFEEHSHYPNWYKTVPFNSTLSFFAPRATRLPPDAIYVYDITYNYTSQENPFTYYIPTERQSVSVKDQYGDVSQKKFLTAPTDVTVTASDDTRYECQLSGYRGNWLMTLTAPVIEMLPRYIPDWIDRLRSPHYVAVASASLDVEVMTSDNVAGSWDSFTQYDPQLTCHWRKMLRVDDPSVLPTNFYSSVQPQIWLAVRLAHTLSAFLQSLTTIEASNLNGDWDPNREPWGPQATPSNQIKFEKTLNEVLLEVEVLSTVLTDSRIVSSSIYINPETFTDTDKIGTPTYSLKAYRERGDYNKVVADRYQGTRTDSRLLEKVTADWGQLGFDQSFDNSSLQSYKYHAEVRASKSGGSDGFAVDPLRFLALPMERGYMTAPYFRCDYLVDAWVVTYAAPFFGPLPSDPTKLVYRGVVTVDIAVTPEHWDV